MNEWNYVSTPIAASESIPAERKTVLVWVKDQHLPYCGYIRYAAGDRDCPYFVVYHGNERIGAEVIAWRDCLPDDGPDVPEAMMYNKWATWRGFPARFKEPVRR
jgi:hypothetical protein